MGDIVVVALLTVLLVLGALLVIGLAMLFRNRQGARPSSATGLETLRTKANVLLVALDEALVSADNELGFAVAQFGESKTADYEAAVRRARVMSTAAFKLRRELDDAFPEPVTKQREMALQIIALSETAQTTLESHNQSFSSLRSAEVSAPSSLADLRVHIDAAVARLVPASQTLARLADDYRPDIAREHATAIGEATEKLEQARAAVAAAEKQLSPSGVNAVVGELRAAEQSVTAATALLGSIDTVAAQLDDAAKTVTSLVAAQQTDLAEAKRQREAAPDPETGAAIVDAIEGLEKAIAAIAKAKRPSDPIAQLDALNEAIAELDTALASARNQKQRLQHAKAALVGTLVSAQSQIAAVRGFITAGGGAVGADARTRLHEAERELTVARAEVDPVDALDAARRAVTHARDADALARYDAIR